MKTKSDTKIKVIVTLAVMALLIQPAASAQERPNLSFGPQVDERSKTEGQQSAAPEIGAAQAAAGDQLPDSPGALLARNNDAKQQTADQQQVGPPQQQQDNKWSHEPVGTAAAEGFPISGVAASRPAGAALAPAKQRRARSILIKVGALVGAGAAVGTVMALSAASPSKPPGSH